MKYLDSFSLTNRFDTLGQSGGRILSDQKISNVLTLSCHQAVSLTIVIILN